MKFLRLKLPEKSSYFSSNSASHQQMQRSIFEYVSKILKPIGCAYFDHNYSMLNIKFFNTCFLWTFTFLLHIYDIWMFREDISRCIFCLLTWSAEFQTLAKLYTFVFHRKDINDLRKRTEKFHESLVSTKTSGIYEEKYMQAAHVCVMLTIVYLAAFVLISVYPILLYLIIGKRFLHFGVELPFVDWEYSYAGYASNLFYIILITSMFFAGSIATLCTVITFMASGVAQYEVLKVLVNDITELARGNENGNKNRKIEAQLKVLVKVHVDLMQFFTAIKSVLAPYYFLEYAALFFQKTVMLFAIINVNFSIQFPQLPKTNFIFSLV